MNTVNCPVGYHCEIYPAWGAGEYLLFFGGLGVVVVILLLVLAWLTR